MSNASNGSCLCGNVTYKIQGPYTFFQYCHCSRCRKTSGAVHAANILVSADRFEWTQGAGRVACYEHREATHFCNGFCTACGSKMPWRTKDGKFYLVPSGSLDEAPVSTPERNVFWASRAQWYPDYSALPAYDEEPT